MNFQDKLKDIKSHPENHRHTFDALTSCCMVDGAVDLELMDAHSKYAPVGINGGVG
jgi:hypothetical protein